MLHLPEGLLSANSSDQTRDKTPNSIHWLAYVWLHKWMGDNLGPSILELMFNVAMEKPSNHSYELINNNVHHLIIGMNHCKSVLGRVRNSCMLIHS